MGRQVTRRKYLSSAKNPTSMGQYHRPWQCHTKNNFSKITCELRDTFSSKNNNNKKEASSKFQLTKLIEDQQYFWPETVHFNWVETSQTYKEIRPQRRQYALGWKRDFSNTHISRTSTWSNMESSGEHFAQKVRDRGWRETNKLVQMSAAFSEIVISVSSNRQCHLRR